MFKRICFTLLCLFSLPIYAAIAVGGYEDEQGNDFPLLLVNSDNSDKWIAIDTITNLPSTLKPIHATTVHCSDKNCIAGGKGVVDMDFPYLIVSNDNGKQWFYPTITGFPKNSYDFSVDATHCFGKQCMAAGLYQQKWACGVPMFLSSENSGQNWTVVNIKNIPFPKDNCITPQLIACGKDFCIAAGSYGYFLRRSGTDPMIALFLSNDQGKSWSFIDHNKIKNLPHDFDSSVLKAGNCNEDTCTVVGYHTQFHENVNYFPFILTSQDKGNTWNYSNSPKDIPVSKYSSYNLIDCVKNACVATGYAIDNDNNDKPYIAISQDRLNWSSVRFEDIKNLPAHFEYDVIQFSALNCFDNACIISGYQKYDADPYHTDLFFLISNDFGRTWRYSKNIIGIPTGGSTSVSSIIYSIKCNNSQCIAGGAYGEYWYLPLLLSSNDNGLTWQYMPNIIFPSKIKKGVIYDQF